MLRRRGDAASRSPRYIHSEAISTDSQALHAQVRRLSQPPPFSTSAGNTHRSSTRSSMWTWTWTAAALLAVSGASGIVGYELASQRKSDDVTTTSSKEDLQKPIH